MNHSETEEVRKMARILVVEDESVMNTYVALALRLEGHEVLQAHDGSEALQLLENNDVDLILSDMQMPIMGGLELAQHVRENPRTKNTPLIFVTGRDELEYRVRGLEYAVDYILKPFATPELLARVRAALRLHELEKELRAINTQLAHANEHLAQANEQLKTLVLTDELTQICNRRGLDKWLEDELWRVHRQGRPLAILMFDLDRFKLVNDTWGHAQGDEVLRHFAQLLRNSSRHIDVISRFGGEEFAVVLPDTDLEGARTFAEKVRESLENADIERVTGDAEILGPLHVTTSSGGVVLNELPAQIDVEGLASTLLQAADELLYEAKAAGRNRVLVRKFEFDSEMESQAAEAARCDLS
jgi:diguanylate cyclase (GGDEF)-like protein